jgi:pilus assembly protein Flp/PilA
MALWKWLVRHRDEVGQGLVEYALILALVAIVMIGVLMMISPNVKQGYCAVVAGLNRGQTPSQCFTPTPTP